MLDSYERTDGDEYNVILNGDQYAEFQRIMNGDKLDTSASQRDEGMVLIMS